MMKLRVLATLAVVVKLVCTVAPAAPLGSEWKRVDPRAGAAAADVATLDGRLIVVGEGGAVWETTDRISWQSPLSGTAMDLVSVATGNGTAVAVGAAGTIVRSGIPGQWAVQASGVTTDLTAVAYGGGRFVAVGQSGVALSSADGLNWTAWPTGLAAHLNHVAWDGAAFVACGDDCTVMVAAPGGIWSVLGTPASTTNQFQRVAKGPDGWHIARSNGSVIRSADGIDWSMVSADQVADVVAAQDKVVGVAAGGIIQSSEDGAAWSIHATPTQAGFVAVTWTGSEFVGISATRQLAVSPNGKHWTIKGLTRDLKAGCWDGSQYIVAGAKGAISTSPDGRTWTSALNADTTDLAGVAFGNGSRVAVGSNGAILQSSDGRQWQRVALPVAWEFYDVYWSGTEFWAVGEGGVMFTSTDGLAWQINCPGYLDAVVWDGSRYLAFSGRNVIESQDGNAWTPVAHVPWPGTGTPPDAHMSELIWTGQSYVAVGERGWILQSPDGVQWTRGTIAGVHSMNDFSSVAWSGSRFVALATGSWAISDDGVNWTSMNASGAIGGNGSDLVWDGSRFVAVVGSTVITSADGLAWTTIATPNYAGMPVTFHSLAWDGSRLVGAGARALLYGGFEGLVATSTDGVIWNFEVAEGGFRFTEVACDGNSIVAIRENGKVKRWNGEVWVTETALVTGEPVALLKAGNSYTAFSRTGMVSTVGTTSLWTAGDWRVNRDAVCSITSGGGIMVAIAPDWSASKTGILTSTDGRNWTKVSFTGFYHPYPKVIWTGTRFMMMGRGTALVSTNGVDWTPMNYSWNSTAMKCLTWFAGKAIAAGESYILVEQGNGFTPGKAIAGTVSALVSNGTELLAIGTNATMASSNGSDWQTLDPDPVTQDRLADVVHTPTGFVACGDAGKYFRSTDGETWIEQPHDDFPKINTMIQTDVGIVGVGKGLVHSPDGSSWTCKADSREYLGVAAGNGVIVAVSRTDLAVSTNGIDWQISAHGFQATSVAWNGTEFVMTLEDRGVAVSSDGSSWRLVVIPGDLHGCCAADDALLVSNSLGDIYRSQDGVHWTRGADSSIPLNKMRMVRTGSRFFAFGQFLLRSSDGITWSVGPRDSYRDIVWTGTRYVGVGSSGIAAVSVDGSTWTNVFTGTTERLHRVILTPSGLMAVGANGTMLESPDGLSWTPSNSGSSKTLVDVALHDGKWVAVASDGLLVHQTGSPALPSGFEASELLVDGANLIAIGKNGRIASFNGSVWTELPSTTNWDLLGICGSPFGLRICGAGNVILKRTPEGQWVSESGWLSGNMFNLTSEKYPHVLTTGGSLVTLGDRGMYATSANGRTWQPAFRLDDRPLHDAIEVAGSTLAVGDAGTIARVAGSTPVLEPSPTTLGLRAIVEGNGRLVAVGERGVILVSKPPAEEPTPGPEIDVVKSGEAPFVNGSSSVAFGTLFVGDTAGVSLTVTNSGVSDLSGLAVEIGGEHAGDFTISSAMKKRLLKPGESTAIPIRFAPAGAGSRVAWVKIRSNDTDEDPFTIFLNGTARPLEPELAVEFAKEPMTAGQAIDFGSATAPKKVTKTLFIRNVGRANLTNLSLELSGPDAAEFKVQAKLPAILKPKKSIPVKITLSSMAGGSKSATLRILSNDSDESPFEVDLVAAVQPAARALPAKAPKDGNQDADHDGVADFLEWAMGRDAAENSPSPVMLSRENDRLIFTYPRSREAADAGVIFAVEWSDDLLVWQTEGVREAIARAVNAEVEQVQAEVPKGTTGQRFVRLRVSNPP